MKQISILIAAGLLVVGVGPLTAYAAPNPDGPTLAALTALRTMAAARVGSLSNSKGVLGSEVTASYNDRLSGLPAQRMNTVMVIKARAELAAWTDMDPTSRALIKSYIATVR